MLYHNDDGTSFADVSFKTGVAQVSIPFLGWGTDFLDYDNDGWLDLLVVNGHVYPAWTRCRWNTTYAQRALLFRNLKASGSRTSARPAVRLTTPRVSRGSAVGDIDDDGGMDVVVNNIDGAPTLALNDGGGRRPLADGPSRRRSRSEVSARRDRVGRVRHGRRRGAGARSPAGAARSHNPICACTSGSADSDSVEIRSSLGRWRHGGVSDRPRRRGRHHRSEERTCVIRALEPFSRLAQSDTTTENTVS